MAAGEKQLLRNHIREAQKKFSDEERASAGAAVRAHLESFEPYRQASVVFGFLPGPGEPDWLGGVLPEGKSVALPRISGTQLEFVLVDDLATLKPGPFGIPAPETGPVAPPPDVILVPGMAFDEAGNRLGRGRGYYDRILSCLPGYPIGICFELQVRVFVPMDRHDRGVRSLVTEKGARICSGGKTHRPE